MFREPIVDLLERGLDAASLRHQVLSNNVANVNTPGYKRIDIDFARMLAQAGWGKPRLLTTHPDHISRGESGTTALFKRDSSSLRSDGNNVDIEHEMVTIAQNSIYYAALARQLSEKFARLRSAITEGRR